MSLSDARRIKNIVRALAKNELGWLVLELGMQWYLPITKRLFLSQKKQVHLALRIRNVLEDLGGAYVKLGQLLSVRPDLIPHEYCEEFRKLQDNNPPLPYARIHQVLKEELPQAHFQWISKKPLGTASIAQVHQARLLDGTDVVIKVQLPEAPDAFNADLHVMRFFAHKLNRRGGELGFSPVDIVDEFERYTAEELNFVTEAQNIDAVRQAFSHSRTVILPKVHWQYTTQRVLTMDYISGIKLSHFLVKHTSPILSHRLADAALMNMLTEGTFHADLHPGNILLLPRGKIGLLDFGIVGHLTTEQREHGILLYKAILDKDVTMVVEQLYGLGTSTERTQKEHLTTDVAKVLHASNNGNIEEFRPTHIFQQLSSVSRNHGVPMPIGLVLLGKALVTLEGTCRQLDPNFDVIQYSRPLIRKIILKQKTPEALTKRFISKTTTMAKNIASIPEEALGALQTIRDGSIHLQFQDTDFKHVGLDISTSSNRLSYALLISALLLSAALLVKVGPIWNDYPVFTTIGLLVAICLAVPLIVSILREGSTRFDPHR